MNYDGFVPGAVQRPGNMASKSHLIFHYQNVHFLKIRSPCRVSAELKLSRTKVELRSAKSYTAVTFRSVLKGKRLVYNGRPWARPETKNHYRADFPASSDLVESQV